MTTPNQAFFDHVIEIERIRGENIRGSGLYADSAGVTLLWQETYFVGQEWIKDEKGPTLVPWSNIQHIRSPRYNGAINRELATRDLVV